MVLELFPGIRSVPVFAGEEKQVTIYVDASARDYGKSWKRVGTRSISFREFSSTRTLATPDPDGILTAVLLDARVEKALKQFLQGFQERWLEPAWYWQEVREIVPSIHTIIPQSGYKFLFPWKNRIRKSLI